ncbi:hypothetical protein ABPG75_009475 [Micractinium tetrahymenae]
MAHTCCLGSWSHVHVSGARDVMANTKQPSSARLLMRLLAPACTCVAAAPAARRRQSPAGSGDAEAGNHRHRVMCRQAVSDKPKPTQHLVGLEEKSAERQEVQPATPVPSDSFAAAPCRVHTGHVPRHHCDQTRHA